MDETLDEIKKFLKERDWDNLKPSDIAKSISIEAAELLEIFQWEDLTIEETKKDKERMEKLKHEIADVLIYTLYLPIMLEIDPKKIIKEKLKHNAKKFPAKLFKNRNDNSHDIYIKLKNKYRQKLKPTS